MFRLAIRMVGSEVDAEDAVQAVFLRALRRLEQGSALKPSYYFVAVRRECSEILKRRGRVETYETHALEALPTACDRSLSLAGILQENREDTQRLDALFETLPQRCRAVVELRFEGYGYAEIAAMLHISEKTVSGHWQRARSIAERERERERERDFLNENHSAEPAVPFTLDPSCPVAPSSSPCVTTYR